MEFIRKILDRCEEALEDWPGVKDLILHTTMIAAFCLMAGAVILALLGWMKIFIFVLGYETGCPAGILSLLAMFWILGHIWGDLKDWWQRRKQK